MAFAGRLEAALKARGFDVLIDREEIYAFEDWWKRIEALIGRADTVVYVLSPDAVKSDVALKEIAYAASLNKRFAPIVCKRVEDVAVPEALRRLNFIFFDDPEHFEANADALASALETDINWIRQHTEYGEAERRWSAAGRPNGLMLQPPTLDLAEHWLATRPRNAPEPTQEIRSYLIASRMRARALQRRQRVTQTSIFTLLVGIIVGLVAWINQSYIAAQWRWWLTDRPFLAANVWPYVLSLQVEQALKPGGSFRECALKQDNSDYCPDMIVLPAGSFMMGSPPREKDRLANEGPQHSVTIRKLFAVSKFELTFAEWDTCFALGGCTEHPDDGGWGRGEQPVIFVNWDDAQQYIRWLARVTGKEYRLLTEAEYEYATRAGTTTRYPWGDDIGSNSANCDGCGAQWDGKQPAPVGLFPPNDFGLHDMVGNVWEWVEDCYQLSYRRPGHIAPSDGTAWTSGDCRLHVARGGSWINPPETLRSASRLNVTTGLRSNPLGFRVARTLNTR